MGELIFAGGTLLVDVFITVVFFVMTLTVVLTLMNPPKKRTALCVNVYTKGKPQIKIRGTDKHHLPIKYEKTVNIPVFLWNLSMFCALCYLSTLHYSAVAQHIRFIFF